MFFPELRRDLNELFRFPFGASHPFTDFFDLRRRAFDLFDEYQPEECGHEKGCECVEKTKEKKHGDRGLAISSTSSSTPSTSIVPVKEGHHLMRPTKGGRFFPRCDVEETETEFVIRAEMPGIPKDKVRVEYDEETNMLTLSGNDLSEKEEKKETRHGRFHCIERHSGCYTRSFSLPVSCKKKIEECTAACTDGVVEVRCPKMTEEKKDKQLRSIAVQ